MTKVIIVGYPKCTTCKRAEKFLADHDIAYAYRDIKEDNPKKEELAEWYKSSQLPLKRFFNTSGMVYRDNNIKDRLPHLSEDEQISLLASDGMLVKRPILLVGSHVCVGFKENEWKETLGI